MFAPLDPRALTRRDGFAGIVERVASNGQERCDARRGWVRGGGRLHSARVSRSPTPAPELTVRAILTGMLLGALLTPCNVYSGRTLGWAFKMSLARSEEGREGNKCVSKVKTRWSPRP